MATETVDISRLQSIPLEHKRHLPNIPGVYFVIDQANRVLYVGQSTNIARRWVSHHQLPNFKNLENLRIAWLPVPATCLLAVIESACIRAFNPPYNQDKTAKQAPRPEIPVYKQVFGRIDDDSIPRLKKPKSSKGEVSIAARRGRLWLRWSYMGNRYEFSVKLPDTEANRAIAIEKAKRIELDMAIHKFDSTLEKYRAS